MRHRRPNWRPGPPRPFQVLASQWLALTPELATTWWEALTKARTVDATQFKQTLLFWRPSPDDVDASRRLFEETLAPACLVIVLEALVWEKHLTLESANQIIESIMRLTSRDGTWREVVQERQAV